MLVSASVQPWATVESNVTVAVDILSQLWKLMLEHDIGSSPQ